MGNSTDQFDLSCPDREQAYSWLNRVVTQIFTYSKKYAKIRETEAIKTKSSP